MIQSASEESKSMDANDLYREETITDRKLGTIQVLTPVTAEGGMDASRKVIYTGRAQIMTPMGALPISFDIPADSLAQAVDGFAKEAEVAIEKTMEELKELRREAASSIVLPGSGGGVSGMPGGGIQMP